MNRNGSPILPIGTVNLITGKNATFGTVWDCWKEDEKSHNMLVKFGGDKLRIVHCSGSGDPVGTIKAYCHDQTHRRYGIGETIARHPHTKAGLKAMAESAGKKSLIMATYK